MKTHKEVKRIISEKLLDRIIEDVHIKTDLMKAFNLKEASINYTVKQTRKGISTKFLDIRAIEIFRKYGYTDSEIFKRQLP